MSNEGRIPFGEWYARQQALAKIAPGGFASPLGMMGPPGNTPSRAPTGPRGRPSGYPGDTGTPSESKYTFERPSQPAPYISDVDMAANWWSPFQPIWPYGPPWITRPREWDFPVGYNLNYIPGRIAQFGILRGMRSSWGILATIIETRKDQLLRIPFTFQRKDKPRASSAGVEAMKRFFKMPDGKLRYAQWARKLMDDLLVIDAPTLYLAKDRLGRPLSAEVIDGGTIFPLIDDAGRRPDTIVATDVSGEGLTTLHRQPAFQQIIKGLPMIDLDESEIMYMPMRPRPEMPIFGFPPTEQIYIEAASIIRKTFYQFNFWAEGTIPDMVVMVPDTWGPRQIAMYQAHFDALLSGNLNLKSKVRFLPGGSKPFEVKNASGQDIYGAWDETMIRLACYAYSVSPTPFVKMTNRATAQNAQQTAEEEGLFPFMGFWKDVIIDPVIEAHGIDDVECVFLPTPEPDAEKQAKIHDLAVKNGTRTRNEARAEIGLEPLPGGDVATIEIGNAVIPVDLAAAGEAMPQQGGGLDDEGDGTSSSKKPTPGAKGPPPRRANGPQRGLAVSSVHSPVTKLSEAEVDEAASGASEDLDTLSQRQINAGNYPKGHLAFHGLRISIENATGSKRGEKTEGEEKRWVRMPSPYGYIRGTIGADQSQVDCYLGPEPDSPFVWVIDQDKVKPKSGKNKGFDEHKVMLGYPDLKSALKDYLASHFDGRGHERVRAVTQMSLKELKAWLKTGDTRSPVRGQGFGTTLVKSGADTGADTISVGSGLNWYSQGVAKPRRKRRAKRGAPGAPFSFPVSGGVPS